MTLKLVFTASLFDAMHQRDSVENKPQVYLLRRSGKHLAGFPNIGVVDRWLVTPKRARIALSSFSRDKRINMQLNK